jgi:lipopolysaccharide export system protein LptC
MRFETGRLRYESSSSKIDTQDLVKMADGRLRVEGTGMVFMLKEKSMRILRDVTARVGGRAE